MYKCAGGEWLWIIGASSSCVSAYVLYFVFTITTTRPASILIVDVFCVDAVSRHIRNGQPEIISNVINVLSVLMTQLMMKCCLMSSDVG